MTVEETAVTLRTNTNRVGDVIKCKQTKRDSSRLDQTMPEIVDPNSLEMQDPWFSRKRIGPSLLKFFVHTRKKRKRLPGSQPLNPFPFSVCYAILVAFPCWCIYVGESGYDNCPLQRRMPDYLLSFGILASIRALIFFFNVCSLPPSSWAVWTELIYDMCSTDYASIVVMLIFLIVGGTWLITAPPVDFEDKSNYCYCSPTVYYTALALVIILGLAIILWFVSFCCLNWRLSVGAKHQTVVTNREDPEEEEEEG